MYNTCILQYSASLIACWFLLNVLCVLRFSYLFSVNYFSFMIQTDFAALIAMVKIAPVSLMC